LKKGLKVGISMYYSRQRTELASNMDNPFPKGRATEVKINSAYNYILITSRKKKNTKKTHKKWGSCLPLFLALQKARRNTGTIFKDCIKTITLA